MSMDDDLERRFRVAYWDVVHYVDRQRLRTWEDRGLTLPQLRILFQLRAQPGITTNALARQLGLSTPTVSGLVDKLVRASLVERGQRAEDRRVIPLMLTEEGASTVGEIREGNRALLTALSSQLGPELKHVTESLEQLAATIGQVKSRDRGEETL